MKAKFIFVASLFSIVCAVAAQKKPVNFDKVPVDQILNNDRILDNYIKCLLDQKDCNDIGKELKKILPDAIQNNCSKCTVIQNRNLKRVITILRTRKPREWADLLRKYDPQGLFEQRKGWH